MRANQLFFNTLYDVGLGTWPYRGAELEQVLNMAWDLGYRHIDTAWLYNNERSLSMVYD